MAVIADLVVTGADDDRLFVENLVLIHVFEPPKSEILGAVKSLDEQTWLGRLHTCHQLDTPPPALVAALVRKMSMAFIVTVHAGTQAGIPTPVAQVVFLDGVVLNCEPPLVKFIAGQTVVRCAATGGIALLPLRLVGPEVETGGIPFPAMCSAAHVEAVGDPLPFRVIADLPGGVMGIFRQHVPKWLVGIRLRVGMQRFENEHVPADRGKGVDGFGEVIQVLYRGRHLRQRMEKLIVDVEKLLLRGRQVIESKGTQGAGFITVERFVTGGVGIVAEVTAGVLDHHPGFFVNPHELRLAGITLAGFQDQRRFKTQRHALRGEVCSEIGVLDSGKYATLIGADKLHGWRRNECHVVDHFDGRPGKISIAKNQILQAQRSLVVDIQFPPEKSIFTIQPVNKIRTDGWTEFVVEHNTLFFSSDSRRFNSGR